MKWPEFKLSNLAEKFISGGTPNTKVEPYWSGDIPWITGADFTDGEIILGRRHINQDALNNSATNIVPKGSIIMVTRTGVGKIAIAQEDTAVSQDITGIILKNGIDTNYVVAAIKNKMATLLSAQRGATIKGITRKDIANLVLTLPPPSEQQRIVEILDQAERLRKLRVEADKKAERILPVLFIKMFGDPTTNPMRWPQKPLIKVCIDKPEYGANASAVEWKEGKPRYVRITDILENGQLSPNGVVSLSLENWEQYQLVKGDLLFARSGNTVGKTYLYRNKDGLCAYAGYLIRFKPDTKKMEPAFLFALTQTNYYKSWVAARKRVGGQPNINGKEYSILSVLCPPLPLQQKFSAVLTQLDTNRERMRTCCARQEILFNSILHRAFTGELTASWRKAHMKELLQEMEVQAKALAV
ncbi:MAG: restriction endonuclease subunit S [Deltaproteobacteria bacterium]|nr:restriction endonuclease subunit S [Deltaproteobacteria bacterium]